MWLDAVGTGTVEGVLTLHALAEVWSVLTKLPGSSRSISGPTKRRSTDAQTAASVRVSYSMLSTLSPPKRRSRMRC